MSVKTVPAKPKSTDDGDDGDNTEPVTEPATEQPTFLLGGGKKRKID